jgi:hypothetical protein
MLQTSMSHRTVYGRRPSESELNDLISSFDRRETFFFLATMNCLISFYLEDAKNASYVQRFLTANLTNEHIYNEVDSMIKDSGPFSEGPLFHRKQLLTLMKLILLRAGDCGPENPVTSLESRRKLGEACLIMNDLLITPEQEDRLKDRGDELERERIQDELYAQFIYSAELLHIPNPYHATVRNSEYIRIFDSERLRFPFAANMSLSQRFRQLTDLDLEHYLWLVFGMFSVYHGLAQDPVTFINDASMRNISRNTVFSKLDLGQLETSRFFELTATDFESILDKNRQTHIQQDDLTYRQDYTLFRKHPLIYIGDEKDRAACLDFGFLSEKVSLSLYHIVLSALEGQEPDRDQFLRRYWGEVFELYVNDRLRDFFPVKTKRFFRAPMLDIPKKNSQAFDAALIVSDSLVVMEHKGKYLSLPAKYSGDREKLKNDLNKRFGKGVSQLAKGIEEVFNADPTKRKTFLERNPSGDIVNYFGPDRLRKIKHIYPVLVVQDFALQLGFANWNLRSLFQEEIEKRKLNHQLVHPLSVLTIEDLEYILPYLKEVPFPNILNVYARELEPLKTFQYIIRDYFRRRKVKPRANKWVTVKLSEIIASIKTLFRTMD